MSRRGARVRRRRSGRNRPARARERTRQRQEHAAAAAQAAFTKAAHLGDIAQALLDRSDAAASRLATLTPDTIEHAFATFARDMHRDDSMTYAREALFATAEGIVWAAKS